MSRGGPATTCLRSVTGLGALTGGHKVVKAFGEDGASGTGNGGRRGVTRESVSGEFGAVPPRS